MRVAWLSQSLRQQKKAVKEPEMPDENEDEGYWEEMPAIDSEDIPPELIMPEGIVAPEGC